MKVLQTVVVKQVLTTASKSKLADTFLQRKNGLQKECEQLRFELKKAERNIKKHPTTIQAYYNKEIDMRQEKIKLLDFQLEQLHMLPLGSEITEREVQAIVDVEIGDRWEDITTSKTIIIEEGIVKDIR